MLCRYKLFKIFSLKRHFDVKMLFKQNNFHSFFNLYLSSLKRYYKMIKFQKLNNISKSKGIITEKLPINGKVLRCRQ